MIAEPGSETVAFIATVHGCGTTFIPMSRSKRVAGIVPSPWTRPLASFTLQLIVFFVNIEPEVITGVDRASRQLFLLRLVAPKTLSPMLRAI
jgi:hypothetical protein